MEPQTELSKPEVAEEEKEQEEERKEADMQSHDELTSNPMIAPGKLKENEKE